MMMMMMIIIIIMNSSYSWRPGMETSGVAGNRVLLSLREVTAMRQLKADHSQSKPPSPKYRIIKKDGLN